MLAGFHYLEDSDTAPALGAATFLDNGGVIAGMRSPERMVRPYFKGRLDAREMARRAAMWAGQGCRVVCGNEPNLPLEQFGGGPGEYADWFAEVARQATTARLYWAGISPGVANWQAYYVDPRCRDVITKHAAGLCVHAYGEIEQLIDTVWWIHEQYPDLPLWIGEWNFGAGRNRDLSDWTRRTVDPFLDWCTTVPQIEAATYFAYKWPTPDMALPTPVDAVGSPMLLTIQTWRPTRAAAPVTATAATPTVEVTTIVGPILDRPALVRMAEDYAAQAGYPGALFVRQIDQESGFNPAAESGAGAVGIAQIVPQYHPNVNPRDPVASLKYAADWMGQLQRQYQSVILSLVHYNGGGGAVAAWQKGAPYRESILYVRSIVGDFCVPQFGQYLRDRGITDVQVAAACGPIALSGLSLSLGQPLDPADVLGVAPDYGWTETGGMNGPANFVALAAAHGLALDVCDEAAVADRMWQGGACLVVSTPRHYYLAHWPTTRDADLYVGNTGEARTGGATWMSLDAIRALDGEVNALYVGRLQAAVATDPLTARRDRTWALAQEWDAAGYPHTANGIRALIALGKGER